MWSAISRWEEFDAWSEEKLPLGHRPLLPVWLLRQDGTNAWRSPPGFGVYEVRQLDPEQCADRAAHRKEALASWEAEKEATQPLVVGAENSREFARVVAQRSKEAGAREHGIVWGWLGINSLLYEEGFCRSQLGDQEGAAEVLRAFIEWAPQSSIPYAQLATVLATQGAYPEALELLGRGSALTDDPCTLARMLRTEGFIHIETGEFGLAESKYLHSLELDPKSAIAKHQLQVIDAAWGEAGERERAPAEYVPPQRLGRTISACKRGS